MYHFHTIKVSNRQEQPHTTPPPPNLKILPCRQFFLVFSPPQNRINASRPWQPTTQTHRQSQRRRGAGIDVWNGPGEDLLAKLSDTMPIVLRRYLRQMEAHKIINVREFLRRFRQRLTVLVRAPIATLDNSLEYDACRG